MTQAAAALLVIPPWQNPDEPQHVMAARLILAYGPNFAVDKHRDENGERGMVVSMARHGWWRHYGMPSPDPLPSTFADGPARVVKDAFVAPSGSRVYYRVVATVFQFAGIDSVVAQMYAMRVLSLLAALITLSCVWTATRLWLGAQSALGISLLLALHPQFVIVSTTASPDAAANLAGAVVWWSTIRLLARPTAVGSLVVLWSAAFLGFLIRRMAAPLLPGALLVTALAYIRQFRAGSVTPGLRRFAYAFVVAVAVAVVAWRIVPADLDVRRMTWRSLTLLDVLSGLQAIRFDPRLAAETIVGRLDAFPNFAAGLFRSFWLSAGWSRYPAPTLWYLLFATLSAASAVGICLPRRDTPHRSSTVAAVGFVLIQLTAVVIYYLGIMKAGPQGRYLFPVLPAVMSLVWVGWLRLFPVRHQTAAALTLVGIVAAFNAAAWTLVLIPAYAGVPVEEITVQIDQFRTENRTNEDADNPLDATRRLAEQRSALFAARPDNGPIDITMMRKAGVRVPELFVRDGHFESPWGLSAIIKSGDQLVWDFYEITTTGCAQLLEGSIPGVVRAASSGFAADEKTAPLTHDLAVDECRRTPLIARLILK